MKYFLFLFLTAATFVVPQTPDETLSTAQIIISHTYNYEFDKAEKLINEGLRNFPDSPKYYFLHIGNEMIKSMKYRDDAKVEFKQGVSDSINNLLIPFAEKAIEKFEDNTNTLEDKFFLGCIHGYVGRIYGVQRSWMSAFSSVKEGRNILEEVLEEDKSFYDAYLVLGMLNYFADRMGGVVGFVAGILGLSGDREIGIDYLKIAQEKGTYTSAQATYMLLELYTRLENNEFAAFPYFDQFVRLFPKNAHVYNWYVRELMDVNMMDDAAELIAKDKYGVIDPYVMGRYYHNMGEYKLSENEFRTVKSKKEFYYHWYYDHAVFLSAINNMMLGNKATAVELGKSLNENFKPVFDEMHGNPAATAQIVKLGELIGTSSNSTDIDKMFSNPPLFNGNEKFLKELFEFYKGVSHFKAKNYTAAEKVFDSLKSEENDYFTVESVKYLIEIYSTTKVDTAKAENLVDFIDDLDNESLAFRAKDIERIYNL